MYKEKTYKIICTSFALMGTLFVTYILYTKNTVSVTGRISIWIITLKNIDILSLFGNGNGSFSRLFPYLQGEYYFGNDAIRRITADITTHPYIDFIEIWFEYGLIGFLLFAIIVCYILYISMYMLKKSMENIVNTKSNNARDNAGLKNSIITIGMTSSVLCFFIISLCNQPIRIISLQNIFAMSLAWTVNAFQNKHVINANKL